MPPVDALAFAVIHAASRLLKHGAGRYLPPGVVIELAVIQRPLPWGEAVWLCRLDSLRHFIDARIHQVKLREQLRLQEHRPHSSSKFRIPMVGEEHMLHQHRGFLRCAEPASRTVNRHCAGG